MATSLTEHQKYTYEERTPQYPVYGQIVEKMDQKNTTKAGHLVVLIIPEGNVLHLSG